MATNVDMTDGCTPTLPSKSTHKATLSSLPTYLNSKTARTRLRIAIALLFTFDIHPPASTSIPRIDPPMLLTIAACVVLIGASIAHVQYPRWKSARSSHSDPSAVPRETKSKEGRKVDWPDRESRADYLREFATSTASTISGFFLRFSWDGTYERDGDPVPRVTSVIPALRMRERDEMQRKPWDPPYPRSKDKEKGPYLTLPPNPPSRTPTQSSSSPTAPPSTASTPAAPVLEFDTELDPDVVAPHATVPGSHPSQYPTRKQMQRAPKASSRKAPKSGLSMLQWATLIMVSLLFIFAFAVLVAHCLAWFVVYKTEARLGEVRKGLLRGGDMKVCLCAR